MNKAAAFPDMPASIQLGVMTREISRPTLVAIANAVNSAGFQTVQLNLLSLGLSKLPERLDDNQCRSIRQVFADHSLTIAAISGTFNVIHPDPNVRLAGIRGVTTLAAHCHALGTRVITLCTGSRDPEDLWRTHPDNASPEAWADLVATMRTLVSVAKDYDIILAFEPEIANVVCTPEKAAQLLDEIGSDHLRVVMDPANLFYPPMLTRMAEVLEHIFEYLGPYISLAHAKDLADPPPGSDTYRRVAAGTGRFDFELYLKLLRAYHYNGGLILHELSEAEMFSSRVYLEKYL